MPKYNVKYSDGVLTRVAQVVTATPEEAAAARPAGTQLLHVSEAKRGRPPKQSLVAPGPA